MKALPTQRHTIVLSVTFGPAGLANNSPIVLHPGTTYPLQVLYHAPKLALLGRRVRQGLRGSCPVQHQHQDKRIQQQDVGTLLPFCHCCSYSQCVFSSSSSCRGSALQPAIPSSSSTSTRKGSCQRCNVYCSRFWRLLSCSCLLCRVGCCCSYFSSCRSCSFYQRRPLQAASTQWQTACQRDRGQSGDESWPAALIEVACWQTLWSTTQG